MRAVRIDGGRVSVASMRRPKRRRGYALIELECAGICNTDIELRRGYYGFSGVPGHEFVGRVVDAESKELLGRRVTGEINLACGGCDWCIGGMGRHCSHRTVLGIVKHPGAFRDVIDLPEANLHEIPEGLASELAVFTEPVAAAYEILEQVTVQPGETVAVLGDGKLGLLVAQVLAAHGAHVDQWGRHEDKLRIAAEVGVHTHLAGGDMPRAAYRIVVEATGSAGGLRQAVAMTRPRGVVMMKSTVHGDVKIDMAPVIVNEIVLVGSRCGRFEPALELIAAGRLNLAPMITARYKLDDAAKAFRKAESRGVLKVLLTAR